MSRLRRSVASVGAEVGGLVARCGTGFRSVCGGVKSLGDDVRNDVGGLRRCVGGGVRRVLGGVGRDNDGVDGRCGRCFRDGCMSVFGGGVEPNAGVAFIRGSSNAVAVGTTNKNSNKNKLARRRMHGVVGSVLGGCCAGRRVGSVVTNLRKNNNSNKSNARGIVSIARLNRTEANGCLIVGGFTSDRAGPDELSMSFGSLCASVGGGLIKRKFKRNNKDKRNNKITTDRVRT